MFRMSLMGKEHAPFSCLYNLGLESSPRGCVFLFQGPSGSGKTILANNILAEHLTSGSNAIMLTLDRSPKRALESLKERGCLDHKGLLIVDGYSWLTGEDVSKDRYALQNLSNMSDISIIVSKLLSVVGENSLFVFDSASTILSYSKENQVVKLIQTLVARLREAHDWAIIILESEIHSQSFYNAIRLLVDCVIDFKIEEIEGTLCRSIRTQRARFPYSDTRWHPVKIMANGKIIIQLSTEAGNLLHCPTPGALSVENRLPSPSP